jgi:CRISPR-associated protein Cas5d
MGVKLRVWGNLACFTRPEFKTERVSYDVMTPTAAKGILESIYWKPEIKWVIDKIHVYNLPTFISVKRNEILQKAKFPKGNDLKSETTEKFTLNAPEQIIQRNGTYLRDVEYIIEAHFETKDDPAKHINVFNRRAQKGQCFMQPHFGLEEFAANFELVEGEVPKSKLTGITDLGYMLFDMQFEGFNKKDEIWSDKVSPKFYRPIMIDGVIDVAKYGRGAKQ